MRTRYLVAVVVAVVLGLGAAALAARPASRTLAHALAPGAPPPPPSALDRANVENDMKQLQLYQQQVQILNYQFEQTKAALAVKLKALERDGWDLDLQSWHYVPKGIAAPPTK